MKSILLTLTLLLTALLPGYAAKKIDANPINIAVSIVEKTDSAKVASTLDFYGYTYHGAEAGYTVMKNANGNEIRYSFSESDSKYPTVVVKSNTPKKETESQLKTLNFEKKENGYELVRNQHSKYKTQCSFGPKKNIIIRRIPH